MSTIWEWLANPSGGCSHFLLQFRSSYEYLIHYRSELLVINKYSHIGSPSNCVDFELRMAALFSTLWNPIVSCSSISNNSKVQSCHLGVPNFCNNCACHLDAIVQDKLPPSNKPKPQGMPKKARTGEQNQEGVTTKICILNLVHLVILD